jgi:hypothetical protein
MIVIGVDVCACSLSWSIVRGQELRNEAFWPIFVLGVSGASRERARADRPRPRRPADAVVFPAFCDTSAGSVGQRFRLATTCAAPDVIADVSAHTRSQPALTPHTPDAHTPSGRGGRGRADRAPQPSTPNKQTSREPVLARPAREPKSLPNAHTAHP